MKETSFQQRGVLGRSLTPANRFQRFFCVFNAPFPSLSPVKLQFFFGPANTFSSAFSPRCVGRIPSQGFCWRLLFYELLTGPFPAKAFGCRFRSLAAGWIGHYIAASLVLESLSSPYFLLSATTLLFRRGRFLSSEESLLRKGSSPCRFVRSQEEVLNPLTASGGSIPSCAPPPLIRRPAWFFPLSRKTPPLYRPSRRDSLHAFSPTLDEYVVPLPHNHSHFLFRPLPSPILRTIGSHPFLIVACAFCCLIFPPGIDLTL